MTVLPHEEHHTGVAAHLKVWRCASCRCVHLCAGEVLMTFTNEEYAAFTHAVVECYCGHIHAPETGDDIPLQLSPVIANEMLH